MTLHELLTLPTKRIVEHFRRKYPQIAALADESPDAESFRDGLRRCLDERNGERPTPAREAEVHLRRLLEAEGTTVTDLSTGEKVPCRTLALLRGALRGEETHPDFMLEMTELFRQLEGHEYPVPNRIAVAREAGRWVSGLDPQVRAVRERNKERIIDLLIEKVEHRTGTQSRFVFPEGLSREEKRETIGRWWNDHRFHLAMAVRSPRELNRMLGGSLSRETMELLQEARHKEIPFFVTPYYLSLLNPGPDGYDDRTIRSYVIYSPELVRTYGTIRAWEKEDIVEAGKPNAAGWIVPGHNIHRRYPDVAILIPDSMGRACGGLCAPCQRMYDFQSRRLGFEFQNLKPNEHWNTKLRKLMRYFEEDSQLKDILITGGDALMSRNATLRGILEAVYRMALRKRRANARRPEGEKYAELQRVRLGTRLPAYLPMRIDDELVGVLRSFRERASEAGVRQFIIQTHFESPLEITPEAREGIRRLQSAGWIVTNQLVFTAAASRRGHTARLRQMLNREGVICYYTFSVKGFGENYALFAPNARSMQEQREEKRYGGMTPEEARELMRTFGHPEQLRTRLREFMQGKGLPFLATDRSVLNLPAIGKSMTFTLAGLTPDGRRILRFDHDRGRRHSPVIDHMEHVYITENKSLAAYLRQLAGMGENPDHYRTLWSYRDGETEPRFALFEYPDDGVQVTSAITNIAPDAI